MGFFSWNCRGCEESIKAPYDIPENIKWQNDCVLVREDKGPLNGQYDGYGRIDGRDAGMVDDDPELWHKKCWENAGKPEYTGDSDYSSDQGFFYDDPTDEEMMEAINATK